VTAVAKTPAATPAALLARQQRAAGVLPALRNAWLAAALQEELQLGGPSG